MSRFSMQAGLDRLIYTIRGRRVMLDRDLAKIYGVKTLRLNEQVKRNAERFPEDFMFRLTAQEARSLRSQFAILNGGRGRHSKYLPSAFTEHGAVMLAAVLNSPVAIAASIQIVRVFNRLRHMSAAHRELSSALTELERRVATHDEHIQALFSAIREIMEPPERPPKRIGFSPK